MHAFREVVGDLASKFWIPETSFTSVSVSEVTELIFILKPEKQGILPPEDIASLAYRIEAAVSEKWSQREWRCLGSWGGGDDGGGGYLLF